MISQVYLHFERYRRRIIGSFTANTCLSSRVKSEITQKIRKLINFFSFCDLGFKIFAYLCFQGQQNYQTMPNRKDLKSTINNICSAVFAECVAMSLYHGKTHEENVDALLESILAIRNDYISRISHPEPGMKKKEYFDHLAHSFTEQITEIIDQISNLSE